jgi:hypothetical protein
MLLYEYLEPVRQAGLAEPVRWAGIMNLWMNEGLPKRQATQLEQKLDRLSQVGYEIAKEWLAGTDEPGIFKLKLKSNLQLRPLACYGPFAPATEISFLVGVIKKGGGDVPPSALAQAVARREEIRQDPTKRRAYVRNANETSRAVSRS